jgi:uncharacterized coiled-coil protein SlyX
VAVELEQRVAHVEGRVDGQAQMLTDVGARLVGLDQKFDLKFAALEAKFERKFGELEAKFEGKFGELEAKFERKFGELEVKFERKFADIEAKLAALDSRMTSNFRWMVGIQFTILVALLASFIGG